MKFKYFDIKYASKQITLKLQENNLWVFKGQIDA